jgi:predicted  nucleic acid-binding Zn-ribbon protein
LLSDEIYVRASSELLAAGYPNPGGERYVCVKIDSEIDDESVRDLTNERVVDVKVAASPDGLPGQPVAATWSRVFAEVIAS